MRKFDSGEWGDEGLCDMGVVRLRFARIHPHVYRGVVLRVTISIQTRVCVHEIAVFLSVCKLWVSRAVTGRVFKSLSDRMTYISCAQIAEPRRPSSLVLEEGAHLRRNHEGLQMGVDGVSSAAVRGNRLVALKYCFLETILLYISSGSSALVRAHHR